MHFLWAHNLQMIVLCIRNAAKTIIQSTETNPQYHSRFAWFSEPFLYTTPIHSSLCRNQKYTRYSQSLFVYSVFRSKNSYWDIIDFISQRYEN